MLFFFFLEVFQQKGFISKIDEIQKKEITISNEFVYYFQSFNQVFKCFTGNATSNQIEMLHKLRNILNYEKFHVISSADGDSAYSKLALKTI